jgi:hypothetical protein
MISSLFTTDGCPLPGAEVKVIDAEVKTVPPDRSAS